MSHPFRTPTLRISTPVWTTIPETVRWVRHYRDRCKHIEFLLLRGINANVILSSAICVDGLAVEALKALIPQDRQWDDLPSKLAEEFYERASNATGFAAASNLFRIIMGTTLKDLLADKVLQESISAMFSFRNCLAHGRASEYRTHFVGPEPSDYELEHWGGYKAVEDYLLKRKLICDSLTEGGSAWDFLTNAIADHFAGLMEPACRAIEAVLPEHSKKHIGSLLKMAFEQKQFWSEEYRR